MRKLALSDEVLLSVDKAARYIGGEVNSIMKDKKEVTTRVAFCFPDVYAICQLSNNTSYGYSSVSRRLLLVFSL